MQAQARARAATIDAAPDADDLRGLKLIKLHDVPRDSHPSELLNLFGKRIGAEGHVSAAPLPHSVCTIVAARAPISERALKRAMGAVLVTSVAKPAPPEDESGISTRADMGAVPFNG